MLRIGGVAGCTHLRELLQPLATVSFQTMHGIRAHTPPRRMKQNSPASPRASPWPCSTPVSPIMRPARSPAARQPHPAPITERAHALFANSAALRPCWPRNPMLLPRRTL
ncbi:DUF2889 domain-containing protein [Acidocella sp.]|uniref:DUF2889 domain-containing protein n=1 Tax=Acidocella sp. TaxID=50710 RepID=UPI003436447D